LLKKVHDANKESLTESPIMGLTLNLTVFDSTPLHHCLYSTATNKKKL